MNLKLLGCSLVFLISASWVPTAEAKPAGSVHCRSMDRTGRTAILRSAHLQPNSQGFNLLIEEDSGTHVLALDKNFKVKAASTFTGQRRGPWNLVAYNGEPAKINANGTFLLEMAVSTRSFCKFQGSLTRIQQPSHRADTKLAGFVFQPPSNVRVSPNGPVQCVITSKSMVDVYSYKGDWALTRACGSQGYIHKSQFVETGN